MKGMEIARGPVPGHGRSAASLFSAFLLCSGCAGHNAVRHPAPQPDPPAAVSAWSGGECEVNGDRLTYRHVPRRDGASIVLDAKPDPPATPICSDRFTVLLSGNSGNRAVIALGGEPILHGVEMLGMISGRMTVANSYYLTIREQAAEGILAARVAGSDLRIETAAGNSWKIDLSDPREWHVY